MERKASQVPQYTAAMIATLGGLVMGSLLSWTSPTEESLENGSGIATKFAVTTSEFSWVGGFLSVGAMFGALITGPMCDLIGRRTFIIVATIPTVAGWAIIIWSQNVIMLYVGRFIAGAFGCGVLSCACPLYTNEIAEPKIRGILGSFFQLQVNIGCFFSYVVGSYANIFVFSLIEAVIPIVLGVLMFFMPESPYYHVKKGNVASAREALQKLRGASYDIDDEIAATEKIILEMEQSKLSFVEAFSTKAARRGLVIGIIMMFLQQWCGINSVVFYVSKIFQSAGTDLSSNVCSMISGAVMVIGTVISTMVIDRLGRVPLLFVSNIVMALSCGLLGVYFYLYDGGSSVVDNAVFKLVPIITVCIFLIFFDVAWGPIPWMYISEIFPPAIRGPASSIGCVVSWISAFGVSFGYLQMAEAMGAGPTFWIFGVISALGAVFVWFLVPETKGMTVDQVQVKLEKGQR